MRWVIWKNHNVWGDCLVQYLSDEFQNVYMQALDSTMCEETVFWDLNYSLEYQEMGTDQIMYKVSQVSP